tara:strand:- start:882 stop:1826 length:945 start_codon:yes stop_codon:yes gene_type:complete
MMKYVNALQDEASKEVQSSFKPDFSNLDTYDKSLEPFRIAVRKELGIPPPNLLQEAKVRLEKIGEDKYTNIYRAWISLIEGADLYSLYMVPKNIQGKAPLLIAQHGGGGCPEAICDLDTREPYDSFGPKAVERGYIVWAPYSVMLVPYAGDSEEDIDRDRLQDGMLSVGANLRGLEVYQIIKGVEAIIANRPEVDAERIGMTGLSYGGGMTVRTMALTPIIKVGVPSAGFRGTSRPGRAASSVQLVAAICPRPLMLQAGEVDQVSPIDNVLPGIPIVEEYYEKLGVSDRFKFDHHPGGHEYVTKNVLDFFDEHL